VLGFSLIALELVAYFLIQGDLGQRLLSGGLLGLFGASLATFGYETLMNFFKFAGVIRE